MEFISNVRTAHFLLMAITAAILVFALSPRDADEFRSAQLEALFVSELDESIYSNVKVKRAGPADADTMAVKEAFANSGLVLTEDFKYRGPLLLHSMEAPPSFTDLAKQSNDFRWSNAIVPSRSDAKKAAISVRGPAARCLAVDDFAAVPCAPLPPGWALQVVAVTESDLMGVGFFFPEHATQDELLDEAWVLVLRFKKGSEVRDYVAEVSPGRKVRVGGIAGSTYDLLRQQVEESKLIAQAHGYTRMLGRVLKPLRDIWCAYRLAHRNASIEKDSEELAQAKLKQEAATLLISDAGIKTLLLKADRIRQHIDDYSAICLPGTNIRGLPHLDSVWYEIKDLTPDEAIVHLQKKIIDSRQTVNIGGLQIDERSVRTVLPTACLAISLFLLSNLTILRQRSIEVKRDDTKAASLLDYPWVGIFGDRLSRALTWLTIFAFPVFVPPFLLLELSEGFDAICVIGILVTLCTAAIAFRSMVIVKHLRSARTQALGLQEGPKAHV